MDKSNYLGTRRIDKRTGEQWEVVDEGLALRLKSLKTGRTKNTPIYRFEKWYVTREAYAKICKAKGK